MSWGGRKDREFGWLYVMGGDGGPLKVGQSTNLESRLRTLRWERRRPLVVLFYIEAPTKDLYGIEKLSHFLLRDKALGREMFDVSLEAAKDAICDAKYEYERGRRAPTAAEDPERATASIGASLPVELLDRLTDWRASQGKIPNRSAAIRLLVERALDLCERDAAAGAVSPEP